MARHDNPDEFRMTIGEHLEELRRRMILALIGFAVALTLCLIFAGDVVGVFCAPLVSAMAERNLDPKLIYTSLGDGFMTYIKIGLICAFTLASPWIAYQLWQFVAAGLYPDERKYVTRYLPLSLVLLASGMLFVYFFILPWTIQFFIDFNSGFSLPGSASHSTPTTLPTDSVLPMAPMLPGDPVEAAPGHFWFNTLESRLKIMIAPGDVRALTFRPTNLLTPELKLPEYIELVVGMLLAFGLSFQLPLIVLALERIGIVELTGLRSARRYVYFGLVIAAAIITPGQDIPSLVGLTIPLILLYELGIFLAMWGHSPSPGVKE
jgi:sec-independent protein translocase protein TatC